MASLESIDRVLAVLFEAYSDQVIKWSDRQVANKTRLYRQLLADLDGELLEQAALRHVKRKGWFPRVDELRQAVDEVILVRQYEEIREKFSPDQVQLALPVPQASISLEWAAVLTNMRLMVEPEIFDAYLSDATVRQSDNTWIVVSPNSEWLAVRMDRLLQREARWVTGNDLLSLRFDVEAQERKNS